MDLAEDAIVSQMIKRLPMEKIYIITKCFQERFLGRMEVSELMQVVKLVFLRKPDAAPTKGIRSYRAQEWMKKRKGVLLDVE